LTHFSVRIIAVTALDDVFPFKIITTKRS